MNNRRLKMAILDAIASKKTSKKNKELLKEILTELEYSKTEGENILIITKLIKIIGVVYEVFF